MFSFGISPPILLLCSDGSQAGDGHVGFWVRRGSEFGTEAATLVLLLTPRHHTAPPACLPYCSSVYLTYALAAALTAVFVLIVVAAYHLRRCYRNHHKAKAAK